jgi:hypothetical protein
VIFSRVSGCETDHATPWVGVGDRDVEHLGDLVGALLEQVCDELLAIGNCR